MGGYLVFRATIEIATNQPANLHSFLSHSIAHSTAMGSGSTIYYTLCKSIIPQPDIQSQEVFSRWRILIAAWRCI